MVRPVAFGSSLLALSSIGLTIAVVAPMFAWEQSNLLALAILTVMSGASLTIAISSFLYGRDKTLGSFFTLAGTTILLTPIVMVTAFGFGMLFAPAAIAGFLVLSAVGLPEWRH